MTRLIDPVPLWWTHEEEDDDGYLEPAGLYLRRVLSPYDDTVYVTRSWHPLVMLREDVLDLSLTYRTTWADQHQPREVGYLLHRPVARITESLFRRDVIEPLSPLGVKVLPLEPVTPDTEAHSIAHAVMRSEDLIGYVCASTLTELDDRLMHLPEHMAPTGTRHPRVTRIRPNASPHADTLPCG